VEGCQVWETFIGPEQYGDVEAGRWFGSQQWWTLQCISYGSEGGLGSGETKGRAIVSRGRGGGEFISAMMLHGAVVCNRATALVVGRREIGPTWPIGPRLLVKSNAGL
jgi:hypothetical protein